MASRERRDRGKAKKYAPKRRETFLRKWRQIGLKALRDAKKKKETNDLRKLFHGNPAAAHGRPFGFEAPRIRVRTPPN
ncbi:hypothetical protein [Hyphococcus luteus]|uniref:Uncharacterized protein n=1 Tax=Hyphococcus luteus TaxID=2058213 RepID=A0A2S7K3M3_9PROT|nr:hypothetical protein [Marinicaulis flavus]PQA87099.1 hypothetical protein CW354_13720 [Marinicaulis flavus]